MEAAEKLYLYGRNHWRTGRGYLYSDNNPEVLFDGGYKEYVTVVTYTVWQEIGLDVDYLRENDHIIWTKIDTDPSKVMYDMHGRTTGIDEDKGKFFPSLLRIATSYFNLRSQDFKEGSIESESLFPGRKAWREEMNGYYERGEIPPHELFLGPPTILDEVYRGMDIQRRIWAAGAEFGYGFWGTELTWYLLTHSLEKYPEDVVIEEGVSNFFNDIIAEIKRNKDLHSAIDSFLVHRSDSFSKEYVDIITFSFNGSADLFLALNNCTLFLAGEKNEDGSWNLEVEIRDVYDFNLKNPFKETTLFDIMGWTINDFAFASQEMGSITNFDVKILFTIDNYIEPDNKVE